MSVLLFVCVCLLVAGPVLGAHSPFSYNEQDKWSGNCTAGFNTGRQSPIDIITANVVANLSLTALEFSNSWNQATTSGIFNNTINTVEFKMDSTSPVITTQFPAGEYTFLQVHMHWGNRTGTGSEHRFNGEQTELEIHFVHERTSTEGETEYDKFAVIAVFADVDESVPVSGFWATLDVNQLTSFGDNITVTDFTLSSMLPPNLDSSYYYYYDGGLTTPPCSEEVQFYLLRQRITVPGAYLTSLRSIRDTEGNMLSRNFRDVQELNGRVVQTPGSDAIAVYASIMIVALMALLAM